ncbi:MAG: hypothetical protein Q7U51_11960 [Methanoregula sp.]|nr:hypothetical protein [Methanoregula sp.]
MKENELAQKNSALWIQYSSLSTGRSSGTELLDNGGYATVPRSGKDAPRNVADRVNDEMTLGVVS